MMKNIELSTKLSDIFTELNEQLSSVESETIELAFKEDQEWIKYLSESYNSDYTNREILNLAKEKRAKLIEELNLNTLDSKKQTIISEKLVTLNKAISMYEDRYNQKEERKSTILFDEKKKKVKSMIIESINNSVELINANIEELNLKENEILSRISVAKLEEKQVLLKDLNEIYVGIEILSNMKNEYEKLLSYNGKILTNVYTDDNILKGYYNLIMKYSLNMAKVKENTYEQVDLEKVTKLVEKAETTKDSNDIDKAKEAIEKLEESDEKTKLIDRINNINLNLTDLEIATKLVEKAETTKEHNDIEKALEAIMKLSDSDEKNKLVKRIGNIELGPNKAEFVEILNKINSDIENNSKVNKVDVVKLRTAYQKLDDASASMYANSVYNITEFYNNQYENKLKSKIDKTDVEKHSIGDYIAETLGKPFALLLGTSLVRKINNKRLAKKQEKLDNATNATPEKKEKAKIKLDKVKNTIGDLAVVSGVRLFKNRDKINKLRPKLYHGELTEKQVAKLDKNKEKFEKQLLKGIDKKISKSYNLSNRESVLNIFNQYLEDMSISDDYNSVYKKANQFLLNITNNEETKEVLSKDEISAIRNELDIVKNYRNHVSDAVYEYDRSELYDVIKYYDEDVKNQKHQLNYIK